MLQLLGLSYFLKRLFNFMYIEEPSCFLLTSENIVMHEYQMVLSSHAYLCFEFVSRYYFGTQIFPDVLLNDIAGPDGDPLLLSLKLAVDVLVSMTFHESIDFLWRCCFMIVNHCC